MINDHESQAPKCSRANLRMCHTIGVAKKAIGHSAVLAMLGVWLLATSISCNDPGIQVAVTNNTQAELKNLELRYSGGPAKAAMLKQNGVFKTNIHAKGESGLELRFTGSDGKENVEVIGVYFETSYKGGVDIQVAPDGKVTWVDTTNIDY